MKINEMLKAFQAEQIKIRKNSDNSHFKSKYADLPTIMEAINPFFLKHGIVITHRCDAKNLITEIRTDEESIDSHFPLFGTKPQEYGSSITYARRYNIGALLNLDIDDDDDGNAANEARHTATAKKEADEKPWFNAPNLEAFKEVSRKFETANDALAEIRKRYKISEEMQREVRSLYTYKGMSVGDLEDCH